MKTNHKNILAGLLLTSAAAGLFSACNSSEEYLYTLPSSATVRYFTISGKDDILPNLDSVFFSIDLYNFRIFNADSLPYGTDVSHLIANITTESASAIELIYPDPENEGEDLTIDYLEHSTDSVDFRNPVRLRIVSYDGVTERNYTINVNVHKVPTDTMVWSRLESGSLPTVFAAVNAQHTAMSPNGTFYCLTTYQNEYSIAVTNDPSGSWNTAKSNMQFVPDINTFTATNTGLYILDENGAMYESTDNGQNWTATGIAATWLIGSYGNQLIATVKDGTDYNILQYPSMKQQPAPASFPVRNISNATSVTFEMSTSPQLIMVGGRRADGTVTSDSWGFDGTNWANLSRQALPKKLENLALVPYFDIVIDSVSWKVHQPTSVLFAFCGNAADGTPNDSIYLSHDYGLNWTKAPESVQIPRSVIPSRTLAQAYPYSVKAQSSKMSAFGNFRRHSPIEWNTVKGFGKLWPVAPMSRATAPITEWDVPYIYMFGGVNSQGSTYNTVFRGVITALTFKPLQ